MALPMNEADIFEDVNDELAGMTPEDILRRSRLLENEIRVLKDETHRLSLEHETTREKIKENQEKIKLNKQLPYLVGNVVEILDVNPEDENEEDGANVDLDSQRKGKCVVLKTSTRQVSVENTNIYQQIFEGFSVVFANRISIYLSFYSGF
jgi:26S proteasome regulatory subunit T5